MMQWRLADAKNRFSEVMNQALSEGPQYVLRRNEAVVVLAVREYEKLTGERINFKQFLMKSPNLEGLDLSRDRSPMRNVDI